MLLPDKVSSLKLRSDVIVVCLACLAILIWLFVIRFYLVDKTSFLDDAFIYLHVARNTIEAATARYFPIVEENTAFLCSSVLRYVISLPAEFFVKVVFGMERSEAAARTSMVMSGLIASVAAFGFFRAAPATYLVGLGVSGLVAFSFEGALQLEGVLLFWILLALSLKLFGDRREENAGYEYGLLFVLLALTRIEYGICAIFLILASVSSLRQKTELVRFGAIVALTAVAWIVVSTLVLGVYPIPVVFLSKVLTVDMYMADSSYADVFARRMGRYFFGNRQYGEAAIVLLVLVVAITFLNVNRRLGLTWLAYFLAVFMLDSFKLSWFAWYFEYFIISLVAVVTGALIVSGKALIVEQSRQNLLLPLVAVLLGASWLGLLFQENALKNRSLEWEFRPSPTDRTITRAIAYQGLAKRHIGAGLYEFAGLPKGYISTPEIGIIAYFSGSDVWLGDIFSIAHPGMFRLATDSPLQAFFPESAKRTIDDDLTLLRHRKRAPVYRVWANNSDEEMQNCLKYFKGDGVCVQRMSGSWRDLMQSIRLRNKKRWEENH